MESYGAITRKITKSLWEKNNDGGQRYGAEDEEKIED